MTSAPLLLLWVGLAAADAGPLAGDAGARSHDADALDAGAVALDAGAVALDAGVLEADAAAQPSDPRPAGRQASAAATDAGLPAADASIDAGAAEATKAPAPLVAFPVRVHERDTPLAFRVPHAGKEARRRAIEAGNALEAALDSEPVGDATLIDIVVNGDVALVRVRGRAVATLTAADAAAEGAPDLAHHAEQLETRLLPFVQDELRRSSAQHVALSIFLFVSFGLLGVLTLRALRNAFDRLEAMLEERRAALQPLKLLSIPLLSGEALRGLLLVALFVGRILGYILVSVVALGAALSQFEVTRPWLGRLASAALSPVVAGVDAAASAIPGILLAALLVVVTAAAMRFARLLLDGVAQGRVDNRVIRPARVPATRVGVAVVTLLVVSPLVVAAAFGRFGTPIETLTIAAGCAVLLAAVPVVASATVGVVLLWRGALQAGEWIELGPVHGEIASMSVLNLVLVPESGGTVVVPMLLLAVRPFTRTQAPRVTVVAMVKRDRPWAELEPRLLAAAKAVDKGGQVALLDAGGTALRCELSVPLGKPDVRNTLSLQLLLAAERGELTLLDPT